MLTVIQKHAIKNKGGRSQERLWDEVVSELSLGRCPLKGYSSTPPCSQLWFNVSVPFTTLHQNLLPDCLTQWFSKKRGEIWPSSGHLAMSKALFFIVMNEGLRGATGI